MVVKSGSFDYFLVKQRKADDLVASRVVFFFKQKTAYEIMPSLVSSEICIRDSASLIHAVTL